MAEGFVGVPQRLLDGIGDMGSAPPPGSGRIRFDMAVNVWTLISLGIILIIFGFALLRIHEQVGILTNQMGTVIRQQNSFAADMQMVRTKELLMKRDLRNFPLHRHMGASRVEMYPPREREVDEQINKED